MVSTQCSNQFHLNMAGWLFIPISFSITYRLAQVIMGELLLTTIWQGKETKEQD